MKLIASYGNSPKPNQPNQPTSQPAASQPTKQSTNQPISHAINQSIINQSSDQPAMQASKQAIKQQKVKMKTNKHPNNNNNKSPKTKTPKQNQSQSTSVGLDVEFRPAVRVPWMNQVCVFLEHAPLRDWYLVSGGFPSLTICLIHVQLRHILVPTQMWAVGRVHYPVFTCAVLHCWAAAMLRVTGDKGGQYSPLFLSLFPNPGTQGHFLWPVRL